MRNTSWSYTHLTQSYGTNIQLTLLCYLLHEEDVVYLMFTPNTVRLGLVVDSCQICHFIWRHLRRNKSRRISEEATFTTILRDCFLLKAPHTHTCSMGIPSSASSLLWAALLTPIASFSSSSLSVCRGWLQHVFVKQPVYAHTQSNGWTHRLLKLTLQEYIHMEHICRMKSLLLTWKSDFGVRPLL